MSGLGDRWGAEPELTASEEKAWYDVVGKFKAAATQFEKVQNELLSRPIPSDPTLAAERARLVTRAQQIKTTIQQLRQTLGDVMSAVSGAWDQVTGAWDWVAKNLGLDGMPEDRGLGFAPIIPIAVVAAAIATITVFLADYGKFAKRVSVFEQAIAAGATTQQAVSAASSIPQGGITEALGSTASMLPMIAVGLGALYLLMQGKKK